MKALRLCSAIAIFAFVQASDAYVFVPGELAAKPRPRTLDAHAVQRIAMSAAKLQARARQEIALPMTAEPSAGPWADSGQRAAGMRKIQSAAFEQQDRLLHLVLAAVVSNDDSLADAAKQRALELAAWSPQGATGFFVHDQAARAVAWTLTLAYDWLHSRWSADDRRRLMAAIRPRVEDMLSPPVRGKPTDWTGLDWGRKLDRWPYDSHGAVTLARLTVICAVLAGEDALFDRCATQTIPRYLARPVPWGGSSGGYANGTNYAQWDLLSTQFIVWNLLKNALGVDLWQSDWARGYANFIAFFLPPGTPSGVFGDGAEQHYPGVWATQAKTYAAALPSPLADWYARSEPGEQVLHPALLLAPKRDWSAIPSALPAGTPQAVHLADTGWVAMHSNLADSARTSVYFKSSPYGSYNHSHADQNGFVVHARGQVLAADSGYYDYYGSPHWKDWYKQTRAHNAITFDGGQGQLLDTMAAKGRITQFAHRTDHDAATGDATKAYGGALSHALRSIVYLRPDSVLVYDSLASATPRTWEWNLHALSAMKLQGPRALEIAQAGVRMCVTMLAAPPGAFAQTDRFTTDPRGDRPRQWHARYASQDKTTAAEFVALLDIGCHAPQVALDKTDGRIVVSLDARRVAFDARGGAVQQ